MYRKKHSVYKVRYYLWFQAFTGGESWDSPPPDKGGTTTVHTVTHPDENNWHFQLKSGDNVHINALWF